MQRLFEASDGRVVSPGCRPGRTCCRFARPAPRPRQRGDIALGDLRPVPAPRWYWAVSVSLPVVRPQSTVRAPSPASVRAIAAPMPRPRAVTTATWPANGCPCSTFGCLPKRNFGSRGTAHGPRTSHLNKNGGLGKVSSLPMAKRILIIRSPETSALAAFTLQAKRRQFRILCAGACKGAVQESHRIRKLPTLRL